MRKITAATVFFVVILAVLSINLARYLVSLQINLPLTSRIIVGLGAFLSAIWRPVVLAIVLLTLLFWALGRRQESRKIIDGLILKMPIVSPIIKKSNTARMIKSLSVAMASGASLADSLKAASNSLSNGCFKEALRQAIVKVESGAKLSQALQPYQDLYSPTVLQMIEVGEDSGKTLEILEKLADFLKVDAHQDVQNLAVMMEFILLIVLGAFLGFLAVSALQPLIPFIF